MNMTAATETQAEVPTQDTNATTSLRAMVEDSNIAKKLSEQELLEIGNDAAEGFEYDLKSRNQINATFNNYS